MTWILAILVGILFYRMSRISRRLALLEVQQAPLPVPPAPHVEPQPQVSEPVKEPSPSLLAKIRGVEWEAILGGNWLNKLGVLVLVIGLALLLGYSFAQVGPAGRIATGFAIGAAMLAGGIVLEKRERYVIFARGLVGGGWAAWYFTAYAAHAVDAARIIHDPVRATILLSAVAVAMILHSLRYRSEAVTGLAYFVTFMTLAMTPATTFAVVASVPLAVSLVWLAHRFRWTTMMAFGVPATYLHYAAQVARNTGGSFLAAQTIVTIYWLLFEVFDVLHQRRPDASRRLGAVVFFLNAAGFLGLGYLQWEREHPDTLHLFFAAAAIAYLVSAAIRGIEGYQGATSIAALSAGIAICQRFSGMTLNLGLLVEGELLFLAGLYLKRPFLGYLGGAVFVALWNRILAVDVSSSARITIAGLTWRTWSPIAALAAALFYGNRALRASAWPYSYAASAVTLLLLGCELPREYVGIGWLLFAALLFELGTRKGLLEFRVQSYGVAVLSAIALLMINVLGAGLTGRPQWMPQLAAALIAYAAAARVERGHLRSLSSVAGTLLVSALLYHQVSGGLRTVAWGLQGVTLLAVGFPAAERNLRLSGLFLLLFCILKLFFYDLRNLETPQRIISFIALGVILMGVSWAYTRFRGKLSRYL